MKGQRETPIRLLKATALASLVVLCGCASPAAAPSTSTAASAAPSPGGSPSGSQGLLGSSSATLDDARVEAGRQPVAIRVPGYPGFSPVGAYTTDPVTRGLDLPDDPRTVAWWSPGAIPGDPTGTVVLAAHVSYNGQPGPFTRLSRLPAGAIISVRQADGRVRNFRATSEHQIVKSALNRENLFRTTGAPRLALITCGGAYDKATNNYSDNVIVYAVPTG